MKNILISILFLTTLPQSTFGQGTSLCPEGEKKVLIESTIEKILPFDGYRNYANKINEIRSARDNTRTKYNQCMQQNSNIINQLLTLGIACDSLAHEYNSFLHAEEVTESRFIKSIEILKNYIENLKTFYPNCPKIGDFLKIYTQ
jgi:hypothetical protein